MAILIVSVEYFYGNACIFDPIKPRKSHNILSTSQNMFVIDISTEFSFLNKLNNLEM